MKQIFDILSSIAIQEKDRLQTADKLSLSLLGGDLGCLIYLYEYSRIEESYRSIADDLLDKTLSSLHTATSYLSTYCNGFAGMVKGLQYLHIQGFVENFSSLLNSIDHYVAVDQSVMLGMNHHDFLHGFIGLGFYWLTRYQQGNSEALYHLRQIVSHLTDSCEEDGNVIKWPQKETKLVKRYNISISHGYSSTIILLCRMLCIPELHGNAEILGLVRGAVNYLLANRIDHERYGCWFASTSIECEEPHHSRLAWCYGDLGIALALKNAGTALADNSLTTLAHQVLEYAAQCRRDLRQNYVNDACICHGAAGVGLIFREMSRQCSSSLLKDTADYWRMCVLRQFVKVNGAIHFPYYDAALRKIVFRNGILDGDAGVALYLLNEIRPIPIGELLLIT